MIARRRQPDDCGQSRRRRQVLDQVGVYGEDINTGPSCDSHVRQTCSVFDVDCRIGKPRRGCRAVDRHVDSISRRVVQGRVIHNLQRAGIQTVHGHRQATVDRGDVVSVERNKRTGDPAGRLVEYEVQTAGKRNTVQLQDDRLRRVGDIHIVVWTERRWRSGGHQQIGLAGTRRIEVQTVTGIAGPCHATQAGRDRCSVDRRTIRQATDVVTIATIAIGRATCEQRSQNCRCAVDSHVNTISPVAVVGRVQRSVVQNTTRTGCRQQALRHVAFGSQCVNIDVAR